MTMENRKVSRLVGLSTEIDPTSLGRTECPTMRNVEIDRGGLVRTRDGIKRLHSTPYKDASWRLRGAPYNPTVFHEYYDAIVIPHDSRYSASSQFCISIKLKFSRSPVDTYLSSNGDTYVIAKGDTSALNSSLPVRVFLDYSAGTRWNAQFYDTGAGALVSVTVADTALDTTSDGVYRHVEVVATGVALVLYIYDATSLIGSATAAFQSINFGTRPWVIGSYVDTGGYPVIAATHNYLSAKVSDFLVEIGGVSTALISGAGPREFMPSEYSPSTVKGYWKFNDGDYTRVRDFCDTVENPLYTGTLKGNHGAHWNIAPQWIRKSNTITYGNGTTNAFVADGASGIPCINRFALMFNGLQGVAMGRAGSVEVTSSTDPLTNIFTQTPAANVGWTVEVVVTLLMERGATTYPDRTIYDSGFSAVTGINPIKIYTSGNNFYCQFRDTAAVRTTPALGTVSDFAGEMITIVASRNNTTITFYVVGSVSSRLISTTVASPNTGFVTTGPDDGPFVFFGRSAATSKDGQSDDPITWDARSMFGVFHEYRLYSVPRTQGEIAATANRDVPVSARSKLAVYLKADAGEGNELSNYGTSVTVTIPTISVGTQVYQQVNYIDTRLIPTQESGPVPDEGLVIPFQSARVRGAIDFRNIIGESTARQLVFVAGCSIYTFDFSTNTLTHRSGGVFKRDEMASMVVFDETVYIADGTRPKAWDGAGLRFAGIKPPLERPYLATGDLSLVGGSLNDGDYLIAYRFANTRTGVKSNISPLRKWTASGGNASRLIAVHGLEIPQDPQVNAIEIFTTLEGDATRLYKVAVVTDLTTGSHTFTTPISALLATTSPVDVTVSLAVPNFGATTDLGDLYKFGAPPDSTVVAVNGSRLNYAATNEPGVIYFSRIDGGVQVEHIDLTPGVSGSIAVKTDAGDRINAMAPLDDSIFVYLRDSRAEVSASGLDSSVTGGLDLPYQIAIRDNDIGTVSPWSVVAVTGAHAFLSESDIYVRSRQDYRVISSPPEDVTNPTRPKIGRSIRELDGDYLYRAVAMHRQSRQQIWFAVTEAGSTRNNAILIYSYRDKKWVRYTMPNIDFMLEVETDGDRRVPIGFVNGFVCQIDETAVTIDGYLTGVMTAGVSTTVATAAAGYITVGVTLTASAHRGTTAWVGTGGTWTQHIISDNSADTIYFENSSVVLTVGHTVHLGSIFPSFDIMVIPGSENDLKRYRVFGASATHDGMTEFNLSAWFDRFERSPAMANAVIADRVVTLSATQQFVATDFLGFGRICRLRLEAPKPGKSLNISEIGVEYEPIREGRFHG